MTGGVGSRGVIGGRRAVGVVRQEFRRELLAGAVDVRLAVLRFPSVEGAVDDAGGVVPCGGAAGGRMPIFPRPGRGGRGAGDAAEAEEEVAGEGRAVLVDEKARRPARGLKRMGIRAPKVEKNGPARSRWPPALTKIEIFYSPRVAASARGALPGGGAAQTPETAAREARGARPGPKKDDQNID